MLIQRLIMIPVLMFNLVSPAFAAGSPTKKVLESQTAKVTLTRVDRGDDPEPVSLPYNIVVDVECKKPFKQIKKKFEVPVCDVNMNEEEIVLKDETIKFVHYAWDGPKSVKDSAGKNVCDKDKLIDEELKLSDFCQKAEAAPAKKPSK